MPQLVTVECHPCHQQRELRSYLKAHNILLEAWYPLGHGDRRLLEEPVFVRLAKRYWQDACPDSSSLTRADGHFRHPWLDES